MSKAVCLPSGGLDSATCLALAKRQGFECYSLSFDYGQKDKVELEFAKRVAKALQTVEHKVAHVRQDKVELEVVTRAGKALQTAEDKVAHIDLGMCTTVNLPSGRVTVAALKRWLSA